MSDDPENHLLAPHGCFTLSLEQCIYSQLLHCLNMESTNIFSWHYVIPTANLDHSPQQDDVLTFLLPTVPPLTSPGRSLHAQRGQRSGIATQRQSITQLRHSSQCCLQITFLLFRCSSPPPPKHICSVTVWLVFHWLPLLQAWLNWDGVSQRVRGATSCIPNGHAAHFRDPRHRHPRWVGGEETPRNTTP